MKPVIAIKLSLPRPSLRPHLETFVRDQPRLNLLPRSTTFTAGRGAEKIVKSMSKMFKRSKSTAPSQAGAFIATAQVALFAANPDDATPETAPIGVVSHDSEPTFREKTSSAHSASAPASRCTSCGSASMPGTNTIPFPSSLAQEELLFQHEAAEQTVQSRPVLRRMPAIRSFNALGLRRTIQRKLSSVTRISSLMPSPSFVTACTSISRSPSEASVQDIGEGDRGMGTPKFPSTNTDLSTLRDTYLSYAPSDSWQSDAFWQLPPVSSTILISAAPPSSPVPHAALVQDNMFLRPGPRAMQPQTVPGGSPFFGSLSAKSVRSRNSRTPRRRRVSRGWNNVCQHAPPAAPTPPRGSYLGTYTLEARRVSPMTKA